MYIYIYIYRYIYNRKQIILKNAFKNALLHCYTNFCQKLSRFSSELTMLVKILDTTTTTCDTT